MVGRSEEASPQGEVVHYLGGERQGGCLPGARLGDGPFEAIQEMTREGDCVGGVVEPSDQGLHLSERARLSVYDAANLPIPVFELVVGEADR